MKIIDINKIYGKLKMKCFEMPNASYTHRYAQLKKASRTNSTFGFLPTRKQKQKKTKRAVFCQRSKKRMNNEY